MRGIQSGPELSVLDSVAGAVFGAGFFYLTWALYYLVRRRSGMGFGDIALIAMVGAFLGLKLTVLVVFLAPIMATLFALAMLCGAVGAQTPDLASRWCKPDASVAETFLSREVPFGVFLGTSSLIALFFGKQIWDMVFRAISLTSGQRLSASVHSCDHLLQMVTSVDLVKTSPRLRRQGTEHGMVEQPGADPESLLGIGQRGIHRDQRVVKAAQRIIAQSPRGTVC